MISRSFERRERTARRTSATNKRYMRRYTRTQHRPPSRQVNDHGRVSGTHRRHRGMIRQSWLTMGRMPSSTQHWRIHKETAPANAGAAWPGAAHPRGVLRQRYQHALAPSRPCPAEAGHGSAIAAEEQDSRNRIRRSSPPNTHYTPRTDAHTNAPAAGAESCREFSGLTRADRDRCSANHCRVNNHHGSAAGVHALACSSGLRIDIGGSR